MRVVVLFVVVKSATNGGFGDGGLVGGEMLRGNKQTAMKSRWARSTGLISRWGWMHAPLLV